MAVAKVFVRSAYNYDMAAASDEASVGEFGDSLTMQSFKDDADINVLIKRFGVGYRPPEDPLRVPMYADFSEGAVSYQTAVSLVREAETAFNAMDADTRARFNNDPGRFLAFFDDEANRAEGEKLGLLIRRPTADEQAAAEALKPVSKGDIQKLGEALRRDSGEPKPGKG